MGSIGKGVELELLGWLRLYHFLGMMMCKVCGLIKIEVRKEFSIDLNPKSGKVVYIARRKCM